MRNGSRHASRRISNACIFVNSGSEANDVAWRMAQMATGHRGGLVMENAYHGITDAVAALTPSVGRPHDPRVVTIAPPPDCLRAGDAMSAAQLAAAVQDTDGAIAALRERGFEPAAFYIDTAITSSGIFDPPAAWAAAVSARMRAAGSLIVADEVQYGLGRPGSHFWGFERRGLEPDIVTLGKPVANGYPMGVVVANRSLIEAFQAKFGFFSTFGGGAVAAAAGLAVLEVLDTREPDGERRERGRVFARAARIRRRPARVPGQSARHRTAARPRSPGARTARPRSCATSASSMRWPQSPASSSATKVRRPAFSSCGRRCRSGGSTPIFWSMRSMRRPRRSTMRARRQSIAQPAHAAAPLSR